MYVQSRLEMSWHRRRRVSSIQVILAAAIALIAAAVSGQVSAAGKLGVKWDGSAAGEKLDLKDYRLLFEENFNEKALLGPKIFAPVHAPFGAGSFDPPTGEAYDVVDGVLVLKAYKRKDKWRSGSIQTATAAQSLGRVPFTAGKGFACSTCYFETRLKFPKGVVRGLWSGFWLLSPEGPDGHVEIDAIEWYGGDPKGHHQTVHIWPKDHKLHAFQSNYTGMAAITDGEWHTYGVQVRDSTVHIYTDREEVSKVVVPSEFETSYYALVTLAVLPKEAQIASDPFTIAVDYIRAYTDQ
jgi:hypothetical protein